MIIKLILMVAIVQYTIADFNCDTICSKRNQTRTYIFEAKYIKGAPDGYMKSIFTINGEFPGPTIYACVNDTIIVTITNHGLEPTAMHWHGILQQGTLYSDGVPGSTQCASNIGESFTYYFHTTKPGTYWYHSHFGIQYIDGLKGAIVVCDPDDPYKVSYNRSQDDVLQCTDWYHSNATYLYNLYLSNALHGAEPIPESCLINNFGQPPDCHAKKTCGYYRTEIKAGISKRIRVINTSAFAVLMCTIDGHRMRLIEADGTYLNGKTYVNVLTFNAGQRYSFIIDGKTNPKQNYWIRCNMDTPYLNGPSAQPTVRGILVYDTKFGLPPDAQFNDSEHVIQGALARANRFIDQNLVPMKGRCNCPKKSTRKIFLELAFVFSNNGALLPIMNHHAFKAVANTTILSLIQTNISSFPASANVFTIEKGEVIDLYINSEIGQHPMHLHGHVFCVMGIGKVGSGFSDASNVDLNTDNPICRDTASILFEGWMVLRFVADNPGVWMFHCHIDWHLGAGLALQFIESPNAIRKIYGTAQKPVECKMDRK
ncbi:unnamed protein product [Didymodactylos carnosus]|uniref:Laccase n=1 Tax=Didymodactylos carnosus TaxID=1234261 RepID=A0A814WTJ2_9BILA|nr:unnamed protein product [Didymodactylos carnosus]CAF1202616.1 unnamed protein product [Didymodactylos carnosus]CAF3923747.1 unnamed protein product [Didymodactylos carnosus]CAF3967036.1 unnamed protein product [Didymodactylos carnosus]